MKRCAFLLFILPMALLAQVKIDKDIPYAQHAVCKLDVRHMADATGMPCIVWFHGGGLVNGTRHFTPLNDDKIIQVAVTYRLLGKDAKSGEDCINDAAAAVAWAFKNITRYGGDPKKIYVSGMSAGGYLTMMVGMAPQFLAAHGLKPTDLAGFVALSGQATKHFNVRHYAGDKDPQFLPKIDALAPLAYVSKDLPPFMCVCGQAPYEWKCRSEENRLLVSACVAMGHTNAKFVELDYCDHGQSYIAGLPYLKMFVTGRMK
jgi:acetyl esterase/lipase